LFSDTHGERPSCYSPPLEEGGRDLKKYRRGHPLIGADGVVRHFSDHPVCASKVASQLFLYRAATPPLEEGNSSRILRQNRF
jgi:hypothetical protein